MTPTLLPDSRRYVAMAEGRRLCLPFHLRWLIPVLAGTSASAWTWITRVSWFLSSIAVAILATNTFDWQRGVAAGLLFAALPSNRLNLKYPVLVDMPAMYCALLSALAMQAGAWPLAVLWALVAGATKETAPVFAALYCWSPVPLLGLLAPLVRRVFWKPGTDVLEGHHPWILAHPIQASMREHAGQWGDGLQMVMPWGPAIIGLAALDWQLATVLAVAYAQLLVATDTVRLYQWAAPVLVVAAVGVVPIAWLPVLVVLGIWNPLGGNGL